MFEKEAEKKWQSKDLWYKVNADESAYKTGFKDGAKEMQEENKRLKQQIEKMKRCKICGAVFSARDYTSASI